MFIALKSCTSTGTRTIVPSRRQNPTRRAQTGMSVLQSAVHEKTVHCPLHTTHWHGLLCLLAPEFKFD
jgi:hypothetical protein